MTKIKNLLKVIIIKNKRKFKKNQMFMRNQKRKN